LLKIYALLSHLLGNAKRDLIISVPELMIRSSGGNSFEIVVRT
jgi:hypothetical protein